MNLFTKKDLERLHKPKADSGGEDNGQVTIIGGSKLFHGAPVLSLKVASRIVDMVFFESPDPSVGAVANQIKSKLMSFVWAPWDEVDEYIKKPDAVLIGPGLMRFDKEARSEKLASGSATDSEGLQTRREAGEYDQEGKKTRKITKRLLEKFPDKRWVIDAGSLQTMEVGWIPENAILTPNKREFEMLFGTGSERLEAGGWKIVKEMAERYKCTIVLKGPETIVASPKRSVKVTNGNAGLTKGGTGDVLAGLTVALYAKNDAFLAASSASFIAKAAADELYQEVGTNYNADDLAEKIPETLHRL